MRIVIDIEANGLYNPTKIWVVVCKDIDTGQYHIFRNITDDSRELSECINYLRGCDLIIGHNYLGYDAIHLERLAGYPLDIGKVVDTLVVSKVVDYPRSGHSIEDYGIEFGIEKIHFNDFSKYSEDMERYCIRDVDICHRIYNKYHKYLSQPEHHRSIRMEHEFQLVTDQLHTNGFAFNKEKATALLGRVTEELKELDDQILEAFPPRLKLIREVTPKETKYGTISLSSIPKALRQDVADMSVGAPFSYCCWSVFNPSSHTQIIRVLNEANWRPVDKTETHKDTERSINQLKYKKKDAELTALFEDLQTKLLGLKKTGWKVSEHNLDTLPDVEHLELWKDKCRIKIARDKENSNETITLGTLTLNEQQLAHITGKTLAEVDNVSSNEIMELAFPILKSCTNNNPDCARFVEKEKSSWWIIVTKTAMYVDCSASFVTDIWAGMRNMQALQQTILRIRAAKLLANRILLESRRRTLTEWLDLVVINGLNSRENGSTDHGDAAQAGSGTHFRIHGKFYGIGAWTHRMAHQAPNTANIPNELDTNLKKKLYGKELRALWCAPKNRLLVGVDAEGIQLRIFAHYINEAEFTEALVNGKKEDKSDPHSLNQSILGDACKSRQAAKRYIYALLLGAGQGKLQEILGCDGRAASEAYERLLRRYAGFAHLKETIIPRDAKRGWFVGLDGRRVRIPGDSDGGRRHLAMSGYLQNGEAIVMKMATLRWLPAVHHLGGLLVNLVHDEWQTEVPNNREIALRVASLQADSLRLVGEELGLLCPLAGSYWNDDHKDYTIHKNWSMTH